MGTQFKTFFEKLNYYNLNGKRWKKQFSLLVIYAFKISNGFMKAVRNKMMVPLLSVILYQSSLLQLRYLRRIIIVIAVRLRRL